MEGTSTVAVILGNDNFVAGKLEVKLKDQGIKVVRGDYEDIPEKTAYFFDFRGDYLTWLKLNRNQKLVVVKVNGTLGVSRWVEELRPSGLNWRIVVGENVFGEGMDENGFLGRAFVLAARNKTLVLPSLKQIYRVLAVDDFVEAILKACFFSGTSEKILVVGGRETNSKIIAEVLVDQAKMTKTQVVQDEREIEGMGEKLIEETNEILRWQPEISFSEGAKEVVQYFVAKADTEDRKRVAIKTIPIKVEEKREKVERRFEVEVEEEEIEDRDFEIEDELQPTPNPSLDKEGKDFKLERFGVSPLPERKFIKRSEEDEEMDVLPSSKFKPLASSWSGWGSQAIMSQLDDRDTSLVDLPETPPEKNPPASAASEWQGDISENREEKKRERKKRWKLNFDVKNIGYVVMSLWGAFGVFLIILTIIIVNIVTIPKKILGVQNLISNGKYVKATSDIEELTKQNTNWLKAFGGGSVGTVLRAEGEVIDLLSLSINLAQSGDKISQGMFGEKEVDIKAELQKVAKILDEVISKMGILQGRLSGRWSGIPGRFREDLTKFKDKLLVEREGAENVRKILPILPEMLGLDGKRREYMVLLQNENEIRPSGGFIGSYAILSFEGGRFLGFEVKDIYEADGQLKGHVEPPAEIKKYLGEAGWFMRDSNWQASFPLVSKDVQWFLEKETGRKVDGVIGLNLAAVKAVLKVTGEVYVADFKEKVNQTNLYEQAEYYSETKFFAGSVQKASFLGAVSKQLMEEIKIAKGSKGQELLMAVVDLLNRNEVQIVLNEKVAAETLLEAGWDGSIYEGKCNGDKCFADYLYIVEANFGVNKANYFLYRNIERQIEIGEKVIRNTLKIVYENTAKSSAWPGGDYKNYMRVYVPSDAEIQEVNWSEGNSGEKKIVSGDALKINIMGSKKEIGFLVTVPVGKKIVVEVKYTNNINLATIDKFSYLNYVQRQSGYGDTGMVTLVSMPDNWRINAVEPAASVVGGKLLFNQKLDRDIKMGVEISR